MLWSLTMLHVCSAESLSTLVGSQGVPLTAPVGLHHPPGERMAGGIESELVQDPWVRPAQHLDSPEMGVRSSGETWGWQWLPDSIIYKAYLAGVKESRLAAYIMGGQSSVNDDHLLWEGVLGGRFGILRYGNRSDIMPQGFQLDVEASAQVRLDTGEEVDVQATDYRVGFPLTYGIGAWQWKTGYYHLSSHLGDEFQIKRPSFTRLNYSRDVWLLGVGYNIYPSTRVYAEAGWAFYSDVAEPWEFQFGVDFAPACPTTNLLGAPFVAVNAHLRQEVNFGGNVTFQAGRAWRTDNGRLLRMGVHYYNGESNQFSFFDFHESFVGAAVWHDW